MFATTPTRAPSEGSEPIRPTGLALVPDLPVCQQDFPRDWYQEEFRPYAEEFLALPDRRPGTVQAWLERYVKPAQAHFGDTLLLLAHFYMGGEIVKQVEHFGGAVADSYQLAVAARRQPEKKVIVESAVHFMAEAIALLAGDDQAVWITNPKAGCTMEILAKDWMVLPVVDVLRERYGDELLAIAYMNTSGRLKAIAGLTGGAACTSSNAHLVVEWARKKKKRILFLPDQHLGRNTAWKLGMRLARVATLPDPSRGAIRLGEDDFTTLDGAEMILWGSSCGVHTVFTPAMVGYWQQRGWRVIVHPECTLEVVQAADASGSTNYLWKEVAEAKRGAKLAIGTEGHFVKNARELGATRGVEVVHLADIPLPGFGSAGCACATMSRNDPPHLAGLLDLLRQGRAPEINRVLPGDAIDERTMARDRLPERERAELVLHARASLERMIEIVEAAN